MTDEDRYYVSAISGYPLDQPRPGRVQTTSYSILDRATCHREVAVFYADAPGMPRTNTLRKRLAKAELKRFNLLCDA